MLPNYFNYVFVHLRQKARLRPELSPNILSTLGPNPARTRPEKPGPTYNSDRNCIYKQKQKAKRTQKFCFKILGKNMQKIICSIFVHVFKNRRPGL